MRSIERGFISTNLRNVIGLLVRFRLPFAGLLFLMLAVLIVEPVIGPPGWPSNHEGFSFFMRSAVYARHIAMGDIFPIWSSRDNFGFGSPQPILYHKLFYLLSGTLFAITHSMKFAIEASIVFWLVVGSLGLFCLARTVGCSYWDALGGGVMLLAANYTLTNWFIRGAMAEFSGAMLAPWALAATIVSLRDRRLVPSLGVFLGLVFLAHSVLAYFLILLIASLTILRLATDRRDLRAYNWKASALAPLLFVMLIGPYLYGMNRMSQGYELSRILPAVYLPQNNFRPFVTYAWDPVWHWGANWGAYTVQLDVVVLLLLVISVGALAFQAPSGGERRRTARTGLVAMALVTILVETLLLQHPVSTEFYRRFPGANFIQFPWRLLAIITPTTIALALFVSSLVKGRWMRWVVAVSATCMFLFNGAYFPMAYPRIPVATIMPDMQFSAFNEYVPVLQGDFDPLPLQARVSEATQAQQCSVITPLPLEEAGTRDYVIDCAAPATVVLPIFASSLHALTVGPGDVRACVSRPDFPALCAVTVPAGPINVRVRFPTFLAMFAH